MKEAEINLEQNKPEDLYTLRQDVKLTQERYDAMRRDLHMTQEIPEDPRVSQLQERLNPTGRSEAFEKAGLKRDRKKTQANIFRFYLMAKKGLDFDQAWEMLPGHQDYEANVTEFMQFLETHPVTGENLKEQDRKDNSVAWAEIFTGAAEKMKSYKIPDIDYSDPHQVDAESVKLNRLSSAVMDFGQEYEELLKSGDAVEIKQKLGEDYLEQQTAVFYKAQSFFELRKLAYDYADFTVNCKENSVPVYVNEMATARVLLADKGQQIRGKTFGEVFTTKMDPASLAYASMSNLIRGEVASKKNEYTFATGVSYLQGENKDFENKLKSKEEKFKKEAREDFNALQYGYINNFNRVLDAEKRKHAQQFQDVFAEGMSGEEIAQFFSDSKANKKREAVLSSINACFKEMLAAHQNSFYQTLGKNPIEMFKIGGKTAEECWGKKYESVKDPKVKETLYKAEILNAAMNGKEGVTADIYTFNKHLDLKQNKPVMITGTMQQLAQQKAVIDEIRTLREKLMQEKERLAATQTDPDANFTRNADKEGSKFYQDMTAALQKCIDKSDLTKNSNKMKDLADALTEYKKAAAVYVSERDNMSHAWLRDGRRRLSSAKNGVKLATDSLELLDQMSKDAFLAPPVDCGNPGSFSLMNIRDRFEKDCKRSGLSNGSADIPAQESQAARDRMQAVVDKRRALRKKITAMSQDAVTTAEKLDYSIGKETMMQKARNYYKAVYTDQINKATEAELSRMERDFASREFNLKFHQDAENLSADPLFKKCVQERPKSYIPTYYANKMKAEQKKRNQRLNDEILADKKQKLGISGSKTEVTSNNKTTAPRQRGK